MTDKPNEKPKTNAEIRNNCLAKRDKEHNSKDDELYCSICVDKMLDEARLSAIREVFGELDKISEPMPEHMEDYDRLMDKVEVEGEKFRVIPISKLNALRASLTEKEG